MVCLQTDYKPLPDLLKICAILKFVTVLRSILPPYLFIFLIWGETHQAFMKLWQMFDRLLSATLIIMMIVLCVDINNYFEHYGGTCDADGKIHSIYTVRGKVVNRAQLERYICKTKKQPICGIEIDQLNMNATVHYLPCNKFTAYPNKIHSMLCALLSYLLSYDRNISSHCINVINLHINSTLVFCALGQLYDIQSTRELILKNMDKATSNWLHTTKYSKSQPIWIFVGINCTSAHMGLMYRQYMTHGFCKAS